MKEKYPSIKFPFKQTSLSYDKFLIIHISSKLDWIGEEILCHPLIEISAMTLF